MTAYNWPKYLEFKTTNELLEIVEKNPESFEDEAIIIAKKILGSRPREVVENNGFPPKPTVEEKQQSINGSATFDCTVS